jgi:hypothetical protein
LYFTVWNDAWLKMTAAPTMRELAQRLLTYEAGAGKTSEPMESPTLRVYEKLRQFQSLAFRALALARAEVPSLSAARISADGTLQGLGQVLDKFENQIDKNRDRAAEHPAGEGGVILISSLLDLLLMFLGEALTLRLLLVTWPETALDDCNSENGRKT